MATESKPPQGESQGVRRVKYGLNVAIATIAALALVVLLNWLVSWGIQNVQPKYRPWLRYDLTATREHSLSPQTLRVLGEVKEPYRIVAFVGTPDASESGELFTRVSDLVDEYTRYNSNLTAEKLDPARDITKTATFYETLLKRYDEKLKPMKALQAEGHAAIDDLKRTGPPISKTIDDMLKSQALPEGRLRDQLAIVQQNFARLKDVVDALYAAVSKSEKESLPDYSGAIGKMASIISSMNESVLSPAAALAKRASDIDSTPGEVKEQLLKLAEEINTLRTRMSAAVDKLHAAPDDDDYRRLREQVEASNYFIVVMSPSSERVVKIDSMFRANERQKAPGDESDRADVTFLGEEILTGALASLQIKTQPLAVFVSVSQQDEFKGVSDRLSKLGYRVERWSPAPRQGPMGQFVPAGPPPTPKPGQKAVWIVPPLPPPDFRNPMTAGLGTQVMKVVQERAAAGDGVLLMPTYSITARFGTADPMSQFLEPWGIKPQNDRVVLREVQLPNRKTAPTSQFTTTEWPADLPVTKALAGLPAMFAMASPIELDAKPGDKDVQLFPLVVLKTKDMWAEKNLSEAASLKKDPATSADQFTVGAAAQSKTGRLVVVSDLAWASDEVASQADFYGGSLYPANAELFVNSVQWLAGFENLIAASPRSQDVRRISEISATNLLAIKITLVAGTPVLTIILGVGVWFVRRRG